MRLPPLPQLTLTLNVKVLFFKRAVSVFKFCIFIHLSIPLCVSTFKSAHTCVHTHVEVRRLVFSFCHLGSRAGTLVVGLGGSQLCPPPTLPSVILPDSHVVSFSGHFRIICFLWHKVPLTFFSQDCYLRYDKVFIYFSAFKVLHKDHTLKLCSPQTYPIY